VELAGNLEHQAGNSALSRVLRRGERAFDAECLSKEIGEIVKVGFFDGAGFEGQGQGVGVGGDGDGGDFQQFLLKVAAAELLG
jgi:hypothetical protein